MEPVHLQTTNDITLSAWINSQSFDYALPIIKENSNGEGDYYLSNYNGIWSCGTNGGVGSVITGISVELNEWINITLVYTTDNNLSCYIDGVLSGIPDTTPGVLDGISSPLQIGGWWTIRLMRCVADCGAESDWPPQFWERWC